jgi:hypothetical protein
MDIICINDLFESEKLAFYEQHGIITPQKDNLLNEIINKEIPIKHKILGVSHKEPAWKATRFAKLNGDIITKEEIKNLITN